MERKGSHNVGRKRGVGNVHVGREDGDDVGERNADGEREKVRQPKDNKAARQLDEVKDHGREDEGREESDEDLVEELGEEVGDGAIQAVTAFANEEGLLEAECGYVRCRTEAARARVAPSIGRSARMLVHRWALVLTPRERPGLVAMCQTD
jgi:hypothetical protein